MTEAAPVYDMTAYDLLRTLCEVETWRKIDGYPGYEISSWGNARGQRVEILNPGETHGYLHVSLSVSGVVRTERIHHLVAEAFLGPPPFEGAQAAHNDGVQSNNVATNLRWTNQLDNQADVDRHGNRVKGSEVTGSKLTEDEIPVIIGRAKSGERYADIAADYGVSISTISLIKLGKVWRHVSPG